MTTYTIAYFITPHGFGHATRAAAVMMALRTRVPDIRFEIFTTSPVHLFGDPLQDNFGYHTLVTDIGMVQTSPLVEDLETTCKSLDSWLPFSPLVVQQAAQQVKELGCTLVVNDISPLGIVVAQKAGLPAMMVENFTWDWIYHFYLSRAPGLQPHIDYLAAIFKQADHYIQTEPLCRPMAGALQVAPISRAPRSSRSHIRNRLHIPENAKMVLVSMGGVPDTFDFLDQLPMDLDLFLVIAGANGTLPSHRRVIGLPTHSGFFHPDLIQAADALVGKTGYSTVAEAYHAGIPFGYIGRSNFAESAILETFICEHLPAKAITPDDYQNGRWINTISELLNADRNPPAQENGADTVAELIQKTL